MLETLLHAQLALSIIFADHINLRIGLQTMMETYVSPHIVTNTRLLKLLDDISVNTPGLLFPLKSDFLGLYRAAIRVVHKMTVLHGLRFYLLIPLRGNPTDTFDVFGMASLPYLIPRTNAFMLHTPSKHYLVISESRTHYFLVDDFDVCRRYDELLICSPIGPIHTSNTECCELALILQKKYVSDLFKRQIVKDYPPIFNNKDQGWIYATSNLIDITLNCVNQSIPKSRHIINGTGTLGVGHGCNIHSDTFSHT